MDTKDSDLLPLDAAIEPPPFKLFGVDKADCVCVAHRHWIVSPFLEVIKNSHNPADPVCVARTPHHVLVKLRDYLDSRSVSWPEIKSPSRIPDLDDTDKAFINAADLLGRDLDAASRALFEFLAVVECANFMGIEHICKLFGVVIASMFARPREEVNAIFQLPQEDIPESEARKIRKANLPFFSSWIR